MKNKPYFECTVMVIKPNEKGMERIQEEMMDSFTTNVPTDEDGKDAEWYRDLGLPVPEHLEVKNSSMMLSVDLDLEEDEIDITYKKTAIDKSCFAFVEENEKYGCTIYTKNSYELTVKESIEEILEKVYG